MKELSSSGLKQFPTDPVVVVISPQNSLIADQIGPCEKLGIKVCKVDSESLDRLKEACEFNNNFIQVSVKNSSYNH